MNSALQQFIARLKMSFACNGQGMGEYALVAGLILSVSVPAMLLLSGNLNGLFGNMVSPYKATQPIPQPNIAATVPISKPVFQATSTTVAPAGFYKGTGYYNLALDPITGKPSLIPATSTQINVAGSNGNLNTLGSVLLAKKLEQLAQQQTDPEMRDYYGEMARVAYYMGAAEGELDDVSGLTFSEKVYTNGDALQDIYNHHHQLLSMMQNPPTNVNSQQLQEVLPLATEVFNIGHNYVNNLSQFINADGKVSKSFDVDGDASGTGDPGGIITQANKLSSHGGITGQSLDKVSSYEEIKQMATEFLADHKIQSTPVKITIKDAQVIDTHSTVQVKVSIKN